MCKLAMNFQRFEHDQLREQELLGIDGRCHPHNVEALLGLQTPRASITPPKLPRDSVGTCCSPHYLQGSLSLSSTITGVQNPLDHHIHPRKP